MPAMLLALFLSSFAWRVNSYHVCYGYFGGVADLGWTYSQNLGRAWADETLGTTSYYEEGVYFMDEAGQRAVMDKFINGTGGNPAPCDLIFMGSDVLERLTTEYAGLYPNVKFVCAAGMTTGANLTGVYPRPYQGYFLGGMLAALQPGVKKVGYIGSMYSPSSIINVNAVALGMRAINSSAKLYVQHVGEWFWPRAERVAGLRMIEQQGVDLLFYDSDSTEIVKLAKEKGIFSIAVKSDGTALHGESNLMSVIYVWNTILVEILSIAMSNETYWLAEKDRNLFVGVEKDGISTGTYSSHVPAVSRLRLKEQFDKFGAKNDEVWCHLSFDTYCPTEARGWERGIWPCEVNKTVHTPNLTRGDTCLADSQLRTMTWFIKDAVEDLGFLQVPGQCDPGTQMEALAAELCVPCTAGKYTDAIDQTECMACDPGYFNMLEGSSHCDLCQAGSLTLSETVCDKCPKGRYSTGGVDECTDCPAGYQLNRTGGTGLASCNLCALGYYASITGTPLCDKCPEGLTTKAIASKSPDQCVCAEGFYQQASDGACAECPEGMKCNVGSKESNFNNTTLVSPMLKPGFWSSTQDPIEVFECDFAGRCPGGNPGTCNTCTKEMLERKMGEPDFAQLEEMCKDYSVIACDGCPADMLMAADGSCSPCAGGKAGFLLLLVPLFGLVGAMVVHRAVNHPLLLTQQTGMKGVFLGGMAVTAVLTFTIYEGFNFNWGPPLSGGFKAAKTCSFDLSWMSLECSLGSSKLLPRYLFQLLIVPVGFAMLVCATGLLHQFPKTRRHACFRAADLQNTLGHIFAVFLIAMTLMTIEGFKCMSHPNGVKQTLYADHTIVCWDNAGEHIGIVCVSIFAVLAYPVAFLAGCGIVVWKYYEWSSKYGTDFVFRTRFLVSRMEPSKYFFGYLYIVRNFFLSIMPLLTANFGIQVLLLQSVYFVWLTVQMSMMPWRFKVLNVFDCLNSVIQILILSCLGLMNGVRSEDAESLQIGFGWFAISLFSCVLLLLVFFAVKCIWERLRNHKEYAFLLTHHRAGAALFARLAKCIMEAEYNFTVFLDVDQMDTLDNMAFTVRTSVQNLVILQTSEVYSRPWCAVEIVTAQRNKVNILVAVVDTHDCILTEEYIQDLIRRWGQSESVELSSSGMGVKDVAVAYRHVSTLARFQLSMIAPCEEQSQALRVIISAGGEYPKKSAKSADEAQPDNSSGVFLLYDTLSPIQTSVARLVALMLKELNWTSIVLSKPEDSLENANAEAVLVLLSTGLQRNPLCLGFLTTLQTKGFPFVSMISQEAFSPPDPKWLKRLRDGGALTADQEHIFAMIVPGFSGRGGGSHSKVAASALEELYKVLAWRFNPQDPEKVMRADFLRMVERGMRTASVWWNSQISLETGGSKDGAPAAALPAPAPAAAAGSAEDLGQEDWFGKTYI